MDTTPPIFPDDKYYFGPEWFRPVSPDALTSHELRLFGEERARHLWHGQYCFLIDFHLGAYVYVSPGIEQILGFSPDQFTIEFSYHLIHPEDAPVTREASQLVNEYSRTHPERDLSDALLLMDIRVRHADGQYRRLMYQQYALQRDPTTGNAKVILGVGTDITALKPAGGTKYSFSAPDFTDFARQWLAENRPAIAAELPVKLSPRQQQIAGGILRGLTSKQIAHELDLKLTTVETYRRDIIKKLRTRDVRTWLDHLPPDEHPPVDEGNHR